MRIKCIECGHPKAVELKRGRQRFFCSDKCRMDAFYKCKVNPELAAEYDAKRESIKEQYAQAWVVAKNPLGLRRKAMTLLAENGWPVADIAVALGLSDKSIRRGTNRGDSNE